MAASAAPAGVRWFTDVRMEILVSEETYSLLRAEARAGNMPPLHRHDHDEAFYVLDGRLSLHLPGARIELGPGESAFAPRRIPHTYRVESECATWLAATTTGEFAAFVAETSSPALDAGYAPPEAMATPDVLAAAAARNGIELLGPPGALPA